jgi:hypothetical protein
MWLMIVNLIDVAYDRLYIIIHDRGILPADVRACVVGLTSHSFMHPDFGRPLLF